MLRLRGCIPPWPARPAPRRRFRAWRRPAHMELEISRSSAFHRLIQQRIRGLLAGADRAFNRRGQAGSRPVSREHQIIPASARAGTQRFLVRQRGECRAFLSTTTCQSGIGAAGRLAACATSATRAPQALRRACR